MKICFKPSALLALLIATSFLSSMHAQTISLLYTFTGGVDGARPLGELLLDTQNDIYGVTQDGGALGCVDCGVTYKVTPNGTETVLHAFTGVGDDSSPTDNVISDGKGNPYGTAFGSNRGSYYGEIYELKDGTSEQSFYRFRKPPDAEYPEGGLIRDAQGNFYGSTWSGGAHGAGAIYKLSPSGHETVLYSFLLNGRDGYNPVGPLVQDADGNLYGVTFYGGSNNGGAVFEVNPANPGKDKVLYSFCSKSKCSDGENPEGALAIDQHGNLYGAAIQGGIPQGNVCDIQFGCGTVFKLNTKTGAFAVLHHFKGFPSDGAGPNGSLTFDSAGNLYGTTAAGGQYEDCHSTSVIGCGIVYKLTPSGKESVLYNFTGGADGGTPLTDLVMDTDGNLYGATSAGGNTTCSGCGGGVVFRLTP